MFAPCADTNKRSGEDCDLLQPLLMQPVLDQRSRTMFSTTASRGGEQATRRLAAASVQGVTGEVAS